MILKSPGTEIALTDGLKQRQKKKIQNLIQDHEVAIK
jgi:uncharacterized protein YajQ (UPF0234 family)